MESSNIHEQFKEQFIAEAEEHLATCESALLILEDRTDDQAAYQSILRALHSLKGIAGVILSVLELGPEQRVPYMADFQDLSHLCETLVQRIRDNPKVFSPSISVCFSSVDLLKSMVESFRQGRIDGPDTKEILATLRQQITAVPETRAGSSEGGGRRSVIIDTLIQGVQLMETGLEQLEARGDRGAALSLCKRGRTMMAHVAKKSEYAWISQSLDEIVLALEDSGDGQGRQGLEPLRRLLKALRKRIAGDEDASEAKPVRAERPKPEEKREGASQESHERTVKIAPEQIDTLMNLIGELKIQQNALERQWQQMSAEEAPEGAIRLTTVIETISHLVESLQDQIMKIRLLPIALVFSRFPRLVRDLSKTLGKELHLVLQGQDAVIDKNIIERLNDPLIHMVRNAADHGIEEPGERVGLGKPRAGRIELSACNQGQWVVIEVNDDGRGIDLSKIRKRALALEWCTPEELKQMDDQSLTQLLFRSGFSTSDEVTSISGRGVGLDVVRTNVVQIGGEVEMHSQPGQGTRFTLRMPLTLAMGKGLLVESGGQTFYLPIDSVLETLVLDPQSLFGHKSQEVLSVRGEVVRAFRLSQLLGVVETEARPLEKAVVLLRLKGKELALLVDAFHQESEYLIKPIQGLGRDGEGFSGAMITADGRVVLVLDIQGLLARHESRRGVGFEPHQTPQHGSGVDSAPGVSSGS